MEHVVRVAAHAEDLPLLNLVMAVERPNVRRAVDRALIDHRLRRPSALSQYSRTQAEPSHRRGLYCSGTSGACLPVVLAIRLEVARQLE